MKTITGEVLETSSYKLLDEGITTIPEVRIQGDDGIMYCVKKVGVDARLSNAIQPGNYGRFTFHKTILRANVLLSAEFNGNVELCGLPQTKLTICGLMMIILGIPLIPFLGLGLYYIAIGMSLVSTMSKLGGLERELASSGVNIQKFQAV